MRINKTYNLVLEFFDGDLDKTDLWFQTPNTMIGGLSPNEMIKLGRTDKLYRMVTFNLSMNNKKEQ